MNIQELEVKMWNADLEGDFHITSTWKKMNGN